MKPYLITLAGHIKAFFWREDGAFCTNEAFVAGKLYCSCFTAITISW